MKPSRNEIIEEISNIKKAIKTSPEWRKVQLAAEGVRLSLMLLKAPQYPVGVYIHPIPKQKRKHEGRTDSHVLKDKYYGY